MLLCSQTGCYNHNASAQYKEQTCQFYNQIYNIKFIAMVSSRSQAYEFLFMGIYVVRSQAFHHFIASEHKSIMNTVKPSFTFELEECLQKRYYDQYTMVLNC